VSTYERREVTRTRVEFVVPASEPWGAYWVEVMKAIHAATAELRTSGRAEFGQQPSDDAIRIRPIDDAVIVSYEFEEVSG